MNSSWKQILYTIVFSIYCIVLFVLTYWIGERFMPGMLVVPDQLTEDLVIRFTVVFSAIVFISFFGASYTVYGKLRTIEGSSRKRRNKRPAGSRRSNNYSRTGPRPRTGNLGGSRRSAAGARSSSSGAAAQSASRTTSSSDESANNNRDRMRTPVTRP